MNQGIHAIDLLQWFMGPVDEVSAFVNTVGHERIEVEDTAAVALRFRNGAVGTIEGSTCAYPGFLKRIEVMGTKGTAVMEEESLIKWEFAEETEEDKKIREKFLHAQKVTKIDKILDNYVEKSHKCNIWNAKIS